MNQTTKRIGFVDYKLDNFHANTYLAALRNQLKERGYAVEGCTAMHADEGRAWAGKNEVPYYDSVAEMNPHVDFFVVLAPSNPEVHLELCRQVLPFGKVTYVDKTCEADIRSGRPISHGDADDLGTAIYQCADLCPADGRRRRQAHGDLGWRALL
jgi:hypothetical protein